MRRRHIIQHLYKHGNAIGCTLPRDFLFHLGWQAGDFIVCELTEEPGKVTIRRAVARDLDTRAPHLPPPSGETVSA